MGTKVFAVISLLYSMLLLSILFSLFFQSFILSILKKISDNFNFLTHQEERKLLLIFFLGDIHFCFATDCAYVTKHK